MMLHRVYKCPVTLKETYLSIDYCFHYDLIFDRELCLKILKEAFFLLAWKHEQKIFQMEQKMFAKNCVPNRTKNVTKGTKRLQKEQKEQKKIAVKIALN